MKISEARKIVDHMVSWVFYHEGFNDQMPEKMHYDLKTMLKANNMIEKLNQNKPSVIGRTGRRKFQITIDDRLIAALYVAMNYEGSSAEKAKSIICANSNYVVVFKPTDNKCG